MVSLTKDNNDVLAFFKRCIKCKNDLNPANFKSGRVCIECRRLQKQKWNKKHREKKQKTLVEKFLNCDSLSSRTGTRRAVRSSIERSFRSRWPTRGACRGAPTLLTWRPQLARDRVVEARRRIRCVRRRWCSKVMRQEARSCCARPTCVPRLQAAATRAGMLAVSCASVAGLFCSILGLF